MTKNIADQCENKGRFFERVGCVVSQEADNMIGARPVAETVQQCAAVWEEVRRGLRHSIGVRMYDQWIKPVKLGKYCPVTATIELLAPSDFSANFISSQFGDRLKLAWRSAGAGVGDVRVIRAPEGRVAKLGAPGEDEAQEPGEATHATVREDALRSAGGGAREALIRRDALHLRHSFEDFVVGESNRLAFSAAQAMAAISAPLFNPLYIHGGTGQGKTHLLHAIAQEYITHFPSHSVVYMSAEKFMMEFVTAMRANDSMGFKARLRAAKLLLIDDIQFIAGKGSTQEEFLHTINELAENGARIVISADRAPHHLDSVDPRILSRLSGGLVADIQAADLDLRRAILEAKRKAVAADIPDMVLDFLARSIRTNVRELEGAFNKLLAYAQLTGRQVDMEFAQAMLADSVRANARRITVDEIQKACAAHYHIEPSEMRSKRRARAVARPRQVAMYLAKKMTPRSLPEIGRIFGGRDHSTVIHAVRTIEALRQSNPEIDSDIRALQRKLEM